MRRTHLAYAASGREFEVETALTELNFDVWCGRTVEFIRAGKERRAEAQEKPKLPNYLFLSLTVDEWHELRKSQIKHLAKTMMMLRRDDERQLDKFKAMVHAGLEEGRRIAKSNDRAKMVEFTAGQELIDLKGRFGEQALKFRKIVERAHQLYPLIQAETEMMGQTVLVELDPLDVRAG